MLVQVTGYLSSGLAPPRVSGAPGDGVVADLTSVQVLQDGDIRRGPEVERRVRAPHGRGGRQVVRGTVRHQVRSHGFKMVQGIPRAQRWPFRRYGGVPMIV